MLSILLVATALGFSNFAASISIGLSGVNNQLRRHIILTFGFFEAMMPIAGLLMGRSIAESLSSIAPYVGGGLLVLSGLYSLFQVRRHANVTVAPLKRPGGLIVTGAALSIDNLIVGVALGTHRDSVALAASIIAVVSIGMSLLGLEIGRHLGATSEKWSAELGGAVLILVGIGIATGVL